MKFFPLFLSLTIIPTSYSAENSKGAIATTARYAGNVLRDNAGELANSASNAYQIIASPTREAASFAWGFLSDVGNGLQKSRAIANGDGVEVNAKVYALALREAERQNQDLKTLQSDRERRQRDLKRAREETTRLEKLSADYKIDANNFQQNINTSLVEIASNAQKLEAWSPEHQAKLDAFVAENKKLGEATAADGKPRVGAHVLVGMSSAWANLEDAILKTNNTALRKVFSTKFSAMKSYLASANERIQDREAKIQESMKTINELSKINENGVADSEESMRRQMVLGTLNNSVVNLINDAEFSKVRSQLAFSHFADIEKQLGAKGVKPGEVKAAYMANKEALAAQYNETPIGLYVNGQISKAMSSVCEMVANQCQEKSQPDLLRVIDATPRTTNGKIEIPPTNNTPNDGDGDDEQTSTLVK